MKAKMLAWVFVIIVLAGLSGWFLLAKKPAEVNIVNPYTDLIQVDTPLVNAAVASPLTVTGKARGTWYFEASFPVQLLDANGKELARMPAQAQGEWMTENFVPFTATLTFAPPTTQTGTLVLQNDNPSGNPATAKEVRIPVQFSDYRAIPSAEFEKAVTMHVNDSVILPDGLIVNVTGINDSRCKPGMVCVWQGELSAAITLTDGVLPTPSENVRLGTVNNKSVSADVYTVTLEKATPDSATIIITTGASGSGVFGYVHAGPTCPVERIPPDPNCADRPVANANVSIRVTSSGALVKSIVSDANGNFRADLSSGTYTISVTPQSGGYLPRCNEAQATVSVNQVSNVDVSCDTGIR